MQELKKEFVMNTSKKKSLCKLAANVRMDILTEVYSANSGHPGGSLSIADVLSYLYKCVLRVDPKNPDDPETLKQLNKLCVDSVGFFPLCE